MRRILMMAMLCASSALAAPPAALQETRYCGPPARDGLGTIQRSSAVRNAFRKAHPCPVTGQIAGACPGWEINHVIPLACGGCDAVSNMDWMPVEIKTCKNWWCRDRFERRIYGGVVAGTPACSPPPLVQ